MTVIKPYGPIAGSDSDLFQAHLMRLVAERPPRIVLDASKVSFMDSRGLEAIAEATEQLIRTGEALKLAGVSETLREVLELTELAPLFEEYDDLPACLAAARAAGVKAGGENRQ